MRRAVSFSNVARCWKGNERDPPGRADGCGLGPVGWGWVQADLKTIHQHGAYGAAVPTLITVQNTEGVEDVQLLSPASIRAQLDNLLADLKPRAAKTGALGSRAAAETLAEVMDQTTFPWVVDPVWLPTRGRPIARGDVVDAYRDALVGRATLLTPNAQEAALLTEEPVRTVRDARRAAQQIAALGAQSVLVKGGHLEGRDRGIDVLLHGGQVIELAAADWVRGAFHGTGCALSAAIASRMACGEELPTAVARAKAWLTAALAHAFAVGRGAKPVNHLWPVDGKP